jgi:Tfp pilus assembly protein PilV
MTKFKKMTTIRTGQKKSLVTCHLSLVSQSGFTFIEILIAIFGFGMIVVGLLSLFSGIFTFSRQQSTLLSDADYGRKLAFQIAAELRNGISGANGGYILDTAQNQQIVFYSPNADVDSSIERIRYYVQSGKLYKGVTEYNGTTYNTSTEQSVVVQNDLANSSSTPVFYYYDGNYTGSSSQTSLVQPVNVTSVKFVKINLQVYNKGGVKNTNTFTITASAAIRSLKTNLGN